MTAATRNKLYAAAQSALLCLFAVVYFLDRSVLFYSPVARLVGGALCAAGLLLTLIAFLALRDVIQVAPQPREDGRLITTGVYSRLRHPIYSGILVLILGLFLRHAGLGVAIAGLLAFTLLTIKARYEETLLAARYPDYPSYKQRTWGILPGL